MTSFHISSLAFDRGIDDGESGASADLSQLMTAMRQPWASRLKGPHLGKTKACLHA